MLQLVQDWYVAREVNHDESLTETLMEWFSRRPSLRDVTGFVAGGVATVGGSGRADAERAVGAGWGGGVGEGAGFVPDELGQGAGDRVGVGCGSRGYSGRSKVDTTAGRLTATAYFYDRHRERLDAGIPFTTACAGIDKGRVPLLPGRREV